MRPGTTHTAPRGTARAVLGPLLAAALAGCATPPPAVTTNTVLEPHEEGAFRELTSSERRATLGAMHSFSQGHVAVNPPASAPGGLRWADVEIAVQDALDEIEAAAVETIREPDGRGIRYRIRTVEGWPGSLTVTRVDGPEVYRAEASIGRFPDRPARRARAERLLEELAERMRALGRVVWFNE